MQRFKIAASALRTPSSFSSPLSAWVSGTELVVSGAYGV